MESFDWAAGVALLALVLSQFPPLRIFLKKQRVICSANERIQITHKLGMPNVQWYLSFENNGGREVKIDKLSLKVIFPSGEQKSLSAKMYIKPETNQQMLFAGVKLRPGEEWGAVIWAWDNMVRSDEREVRLLESEAKNDVERLRSNMNNSEGVPLPIGPEAYNKIMAFYQSKFRWTTGEYTIEVNARVNGVDTSFGKYRLTLFEHDESFQRSISERYVHGDGVFYYSNINAWLNLPLAEL